MRIKVYELAKELGQDGQVLVETIQRLGIDIKNSMSALGMEEVRLVREHFNKLKPLSKSTPAPVRQSITEKRVGATVIRRRKKEEEKREAVETPSDDVESEVTENAASELLSQEAPSSETAAAPLELHASKKKLSFPSIIKKVGTEEYLGEKVGPKVEKREKPSKAPAEVNPDAKPATASSTTPTASAAPKRIREIDLASVEAAAKEAGKKRLMERQSAVFKSADYLKRELIHATKKKKTTMSRPALKTQITRKADRKRMVEMGEKIAVGELARQMGVKATAVLAKLMGMGVTSTINESVDPDTAALVAHEFQYEVRQAATSREDSYVSHVDLDPAKLKSRPPVVTIMGHVDHGKTSLLDAIRKTNVAAGEAGGITQHIGAYTVKVGDKTITFIDTPGHEAFTAMRARGAKVTDVVVLVVSAVDGVMPQTLESVSHAQAASVPIIVAVNKTDLPDATPERVKQTLAGHNLSPEEWGGETIYINVSAKTGQGIDALLESILLQAEILELKANYQDTARGTVIESKLDKAKGPVCTVLVQHGVLKIGDLVVCGVVSGKIRAMADSFGNRLQQASPGDPVEILGLSQVPGVGDVLMVMDTEERARELLDLRVTKKRETTLARPKLTLEEILASATQTGEKELRLILKADVQGSEEALKEAMSKLPTEKVKTKILHSGLGGITEGDVMLASASNAVIVGFNVRPDMKATKLGEAEGIQVKTYTIIYELLDDLKKLLAGLLDKIIREKVIGRAEIREVFHIPKVGSIAGSSVIDGKVTRGCHLRLLRDNRVVYVGKLASLKRFKDDVKEVGQGFECGISLENFNDLKQGDHFEAFIKEEVQASL